MYDRQDLCLCMDNAIKNSVPDMDEFPQGSSFRIAFGIIRKIHS